MDFASLMSSAMSKSKNAPPANASSAPSSSPSTTTTAAGANHPAGGSKYLRKADVEAQRRAAYLADQATAREERERRSAAKRKLEEEEAERTRIREEKRRRIAEESRLRREEEEAAEEAMRRKRLGLPPVAPKDSVDDDDAATDREGSGPLRDGETDLSEAELVAKLRGLGEPAILFGETHGARVRRYYAAAAPKKKKKVLSDGPVPTTLELLQEKDMRVPLKPPPPGEDRDYLFRQLASYFTLVLVEWIRALGERTAEVRESQQGRQAYQAMEQSRENLRPLFRKFEKGDLEDSILAPVVEIVRAAQERRYVDANDGYLRLSIGKAAWPIGVTMIGIHERSARERLNESETKTHILSDESTRKYLQSIKRCLTFAQTRWPPDNQLQLMG